MNREEFYGKLAGLDGDALRKVLWTLCWRGTAAVRGRIEDELAPPDTVRAKRAAAELPDPELVLGETREFVELARSGAYMAGDRRVSPRARSRWRLTFRRLASDAQRALRAQDPAPAESALEQLVDLACETRDYDYFHSEDPMEAAQFVVSDAVALLWEAVRERVGFAEFASRAAPQLIRWESRYGWSRSGWGALSQKEAPLASVLAAMLRAPDMWATFAGRYLDALDRVASDPKAPARLVVFSSGPDAGWGRKYELRRRSDALAGWHLMLADRLDGGEHSGLLDRLVAHPALGGAEQTLLRARLAQRRGDLAAAHDLVREVLEDLPGHGGALEFAAEIGAPLPAKARQIAEGRPEWAPLAPIPE